MSEDGARFSDRACLYECGGTRERFGRKPHGFRYGKSHDGTSGSTYLEVKDGAVRYQDITKQPHVDLFIKNMHLLATGLRNRAGERGRDFPAEISVDGDSLGGGRLKLFIAAEPLAAQPHFHLSAKLDSVNLPDLNESLKAYANVDVGRGTFRMAAEMAGKDGGFQGYVKPFFEDLDFNNLEDKKKGVFNRIWENAVAGLAWLVKNKQRDQVGTRIPFEGRFGDSKVGLWTTITNLFRHGFIRAFNPTVEGSVHADNVLSSGKSADGKDVAVARARSSRFQVRIGALRVCFAAMLRYSVFRAVH